MVGVWQGEGLKNIHCDKWLVQPYIKLYFNKIFTRNLTEVSISKIMLYLDDETEVLLRNCAQSAGLSNSEWVANLIRQNAKTQWPAEILQLAGTFPDFPLRN